MAGFSGPRQKRRPSERTSGISAGNSIGGGVVILVSVSVDKILCHGNVATIMNRRILCAEQPWS